MALLTNKWFVSLLMLSSYFLFVANSSNPPNARTNAPFDGYCGDCHSGGAFTGNIVLTGLPSTIAPNTLYPLTITVNNTAGGASTAGYQLVAVDNSNGNLGTLSAPNVQSGTDVSGGRTYIEHRGSKPYSGGNASWTVNWTSPASAAGNTAKFYFAGLMGNGGSSSGDNPISGLVTVPFQAANPVLNLSVTGTNVSCRGGNNGTATATPTGGVPPYSYVWSPSGNSSTISNLVAGTYNVTVTDAASQVRTGSYTVTQPLNALSVSLSTPGVLTCSNISTSITATPQGGTPNYTYSWSNNQQTASINVASPGTYTVTVTDSRGCTQIASTNVSQNNLVPTSNAGPTRNLTCAAPTAILDGSSSSQGANFSYLWTTTNGNIVSGASTVSPTIDRAGTYSLRVTNTTNGCFATSTVLITSSANPPTSNAGPARVLTCTSPTAILDGSASSQGVDISYLWTTTNGNIVSGGTTNSPTIDRAGTYTLRVSNSTNGCSATSTVTVTSNTTLPTSNAGPSRLLTCTSPTAILDGGTSSQGPGFSYLWTTTDGNIVSGANSINPSVDKAGTYSLRVTNSANGCFSNSSVTVTSNLIAPVSNAGNGGVVTCLTPIITLAGSGSTQGTITYLWTTTNGNIVSGSTTLTPMVDTSGTYNLRATDITNGCFSNSSVIVTQDKVRPQANAGPDKVLNCANPTVNLDGSQSSSGPNISYTWTTANGQIVSGDTSPSPVVGQVGSYNLEVRNTTNGCQNIDQVLVTSNTQLPLVSGGQDKIIGCSNPSVVLVATAIPNNVVFNWTGPGIQGPSNTSTVTVNQAGLYIVEGLNPTNGCSARDTVVVSNNQTFVASVSPNNPTLTCDRTKITLTANSSQPGTYTYAWSGLGTIINPNGYEVSAPASYTVTITEPSTGCTSVSSTNVIFESGDLDVSGQRNLTLGCNPDSVVIQFTSKPNQTYRWRGPSFTGSPIGNRIVTKTSGDFILTIFDIQTGCNREDTFKVQSRTTKPIVAIESPSSFVVTCKSTVECITLRAVANEPVTYIWSEPNSTRDTLRACEVKGYTITVTNAFGCTNSSNYIPNPSTDRTPPEIKVDSTFGNPNCNISAFKLIGSSSTPNAISEWRGPNGSIIQGLEPVITNTGRYTFTVTNPRNGCTASQSVNVNNLIAPLNITLNSTTPTGQGQNNGSIQITTSGGNAPLTFKWTTASGTVVSTVEDPNNLSKGIYTLEVQDKLGCTKSLGPISVFTTSVATIQDLGLEVFPNPFMSELMIKSGNEAGVAILYSLDGRAVGRTLFSIGENALETGDLSSGMYILEIDINGKKARTLVIRN
jgi:hypothetical protein